MHAVDASAPDVDERIAAVDGVLREIGADAVPRLLAWNKADLADPDDLKASLATSSRIGRAVGRDR